MMTYVVFYVALPFSHTFEIDRQCSLLFLGNYKRIDRPDVKIKNHGLGQYGAEPHYSTSPFWQLCALKG